MRTWHVYALCEPITMTVRYVGWAFKPRRRLVEHMCRAKRERSHKAAWLRQLAAAGQIPGMTILESGTGDWAEAEQRWIKHFRDNGMKLTNLTDGGEGVVGLLFSQESRAKMRAAKVGRKLTQEHVAKVAAAHRGKKRSPETCAAIATGRRGIKVSAEGRARISASQIGRKHTEAAKVKIAAASRARDNRTFLEAGVAARLGKPLSAEHTAKLRAAKLGRNLTEEHKAKIRGHGGWKHSPESLEKITAARRARAAAQRAAKT